MSDANLPGSNDVVAVDTVVVDLAPEPLNRGHQVSDPRWSHYLGWILPHIFILAYCFVILAAMATQVFGHEFPCPLCMLQRYAMMMASIGAVWIIARAGNGTLTMSRYMCGYGLSLLSVVLGAAISVRQILDHVTGKVINPATNQVEVDPTTGLDVVDPGYGGTVLGLHLYTWALVTFIVVMIYIGVLMCLSRSTYPVAPPSRGLRVASKVIIIFFLVVLAANLLSVFLEEGFNWYLPDNPTQYELLYQLGIKK